MVPAQSGDGDGQLLKIEVFAVAVSVARERGVEVHVAQPQAADEPVRGRRQQRALVRQAQPEEVGVRMQGARLELLAVVDDRLLVRAIAAKKVVKTAGADGIGRREVKGGGALDGFRGVNSERAEAELRSRRAGRRVARREELAHLEPADRRSDATAKRELPAIQRRVIAQS